MVWRNLQNNSSIQRRLRSSRGSVHSDQSLWCPRDEALNPWQPMERHAAAQADLQWLFTACTCHFGGFALSLPCYHWHNGRKSFKINTSNSISFWHTTLMQWVDQHLLWRASCRPKSGSASNKTFWTKVYQYIFSGYYSIESSTIPLLYLLLRITLN